MSGKFNDKNSEYNKDASFASFSIDETTKVTLSEAVAKDSDDNFLTVYGWVDFPLTGVEKFGDRMWIYEPQLCKFRIPKKDSTKEYQGKKTETKQSPGMKAAVHLIGEYGFDKPFSGLFDFGMAEPIANSLITGKSPDGNPTSETELAMLGQYFMAVRPLEKLEKLEGVEIKEQSRSGGYGGKGGGQKESEKLADRVAFLKKIVDGHEEIDSILLALHGEKAAEGKQILLCKMLDSLFN